MAVLPGDAETTEEKGAQVEAGPRASEPALGVSVTSSFKALRPASPQQPHDQSCPGSLDPSIGISNSKTVCLNQL